MEIKLKINKRRPEATEEIGVYMQGLEDGAKAAVKVLGELLGDKNRLRTKRRKI